MIAGFGANILVYDPYTPDDKIRGDGYIPMELNKVIQNSLM